MQSFVLFSYPIVAQFSTYIIFVLKSKRKLNVVYIFSNHSKGGVLCCERILETGANLKGTISKKGSDQ